MLRGYSSTVEQFQNCCSRGLWPVNLGADFHNLQTAHRAVATEKKQIYAAFFSPENAPRSFFNHAEKR